MTVNSFYQTFTARNEGYIAPAVQEKLGRLRVLVAGCGIGSSFAEMAVRLGIRHFVLVDGDQVSATNLNRQFFSYRDIGQANPDHSPGCEWTA